MANSHCESSTRNKWGQSEKRKQHAAPPRRRSTATRASPRVPARVAVPRENARGHAGTRGGRRQSRGGGAGTRGGAAHTHLVIVYRNCQKGGKFYRTIPVEIASRSFAAPPNGVVLHVQSFAETVASWVHLCDGIFSTRKKKDK